MINQGKTYRVLRDQCPHLNPLPYCEAKADLVLVLKKRKQAVEMVLSMLDDGDDNVLRMFAKDVLGQLNTKLHQLR